MTSLWADFLSNNERVTHKWAHYFPVYEAHFRRFVDRPVTLLEIGCGWGGSLQMWKRYLGPLARVVGVDILERARAFAEDQIDIRIGDQKDEVFLASLIDEFGAPDIVIDDGSHRSSDITASFRYLYPRTSPSGVYVVEDLHAAYWEEFEGGLRRDGTFIEVCKSLIDELHAGYTRGELAPTAFTQSTMSMHFYDSIVAIERGRPYRRAAALQTGRIGPPTPT